MAPFAALGLHRLLLRGGAQALYQPPESVIAFFGRPARVRRGQGRHVAGASSTSAALSATFTAPPARIESYTDSAARTAS